MRIAGLAWRASSFGLAALIVWLFFTQWNHWEGRARWQATDDAYLQADLTPLSAQVSGYVRSVPIQDYQHVRTGQIIVQIDDADYRAEVAQARANVAAAEAQIEQVHAQRPLLKANLRAAQAVATATSASFAQSGRDVARQRRLVSTGSASTEDLERVETQHAQLAAQFAQNQAQIDAVARQIDLLKAQEDVAAAALQAQGAALDQALINLGYTRITAPADGMVGLRQVFTGQFLASGTQVTTLSSLPHVWVLANYKETQLTQVRVGQSATITVDAFPGHNLRGHVLAISPVSGAQLALLPPDNATGNFTKIVQRVGVKIAIDDAGGIADQLRQGMSVIPEIDTASGQAQ